MAKATVNIAGILAGMGSGTPCGDLAAVSLEEGDVIVSFTAPSLISIFAVNHGLTSESIEVDRLENMGSGIATDSGDIRTTAKKSRCTDSQNIGLPLRDDHRGDGIGDEIVTEADLTTITSHAERAGIAGVAGETEHISGRIEHGDKAASTDTGDVTHLESAGRAVDKIEHHEVASIGIEAIAIDKSLADIVAGKSLKRQAERISHLLLPRVALDAIIDGGIQRSHQSVISHQRRRRLSHLIRRDTGTGTADIARGIARRVDTHNEIESLRERHVRVNGQRALHGAETIVAGEAMETEMPITRDMGEHARAVATATTIAFIAEISPLTSHIDAELIHETLRVIPEIVLNGSQTVVGHVVLTYHTLDFRINHIDESCTCSVLMRGE